MIRRARERMQKTPLSRRFPLIHRDRSINTSLIELQWMFPPFVTRVPLLPPNEQREILHLPSTLRGLKHPLVASTQHSSTTSIVLSVAHSF